MPCRCYRRRESGEASADLHGGRVLAELKRRCPELQAFGIGGETLRAAGLEAVASAEEISVGGLTEVLLAIPRIFGILRRSAEAPLRVVRQGR